MAFSERPEGATALRRTWTRRDFLKAAGVGTAGIAMLGANACDSESGVKKEAPRGASGDGGPNVVLIVVDTLRKDHIGAYGNDWMRTPNLDALAGESLRFTRAYPESTPTICARRAIHTGTRTWPFRNWDPPEGENISLRGWQPIPLDQVTLAEVLNENGYLNLFVTDNLQQYKPAYNMHRGFDVWDFLRGQTTDKYRPIWTCPPESLERTLVNEGSGTGGEQYFAQYFANTADRRNEEDWFAPKVFNRASEFLESAKNVGPFFLTVDVYDPHAPWDPPEKYTNMYSDGFDGPEPYAAVYGPSDYLTDAQVDRMNALYAGELTMMDRWLGRFMDKMEDLDLFKDTLVLLLSDHGIILGEHGLVGKPHYALYPETVDVPFMIRHPGGKLAGDTSDFFASTHDVAPTILGHLGIDPPEQMTGQNLMSFFEGGEPEPRPHFTLGYHDHVWARDDRYVMFSADDGGGAKLFDVQEDPKMEKDLAAANRDVVKRMYEGYVLRDAGGPLPEYG